MNTPRGNHVHGTDLVDATSTSAYVVVPGSESDCRNAESYYIQGTITTNTIDVALFTANKADFSDEILYAADTSQVAGPYKKQVVDPGFSYARTKIKDTVGGTHGLLTKTSVFVK